MGKLDEVIKGLPEETQTIVQTVWDRMPESQRGSLAAFINKIPIDSRMQILLGLVEKEYRYAFGKKSRVAIVGPANVGKSTLYNQLITSKKDKAEVSPIPGTTRVNKEADAGIFSIVDTPGADAVGEKGDQERQSALDAASQADFLIIIFDAIQGIKRGEQELFRQLVGYRKPYIVVLNKIDLVKRDANRVIAKVAESLGLKPEQVNGISAKESKNLERIILSIASAEPEIVAALGCALPAYRWQLAWRVIASGASAAALIGLIPLPFIDFIPLALTQSVMVIAIARIYDYRITPARAGELVAAFGLGFLGRTLFAEISKLGGVPGWILAAAIAASVTVAMGYAAALWFERGQRLTQDNLKKISQVMIVYLTNAIKGFGKRKPSQEELRQTINEALRNAPVAEDRGFFDRETDLSNKEETQ